MGGEEEKRVRAEKCSTTSCAEDRDYETDGRRIGAQEAQSRERESQEGGETSTTSCEMTGHKRAGPRGTGGHES